MEVSSADVQLLREAFFQKIQDSGQNETELFHVNDLEKVKNGNDWLRRFLLHHENDQKEALNMLWEACDWRKKFGANDISEKNVNIKLLENGNIFAHNRDKDGRALLIFKSKKHIKNQFDPEEQKRALVYWMERLERQESGKMISIFFDMDGAGVSNMDMDYTRYLIGLFKLYYPYFLNYILVFEMGWGLSAAFKIIKSWLPPKAVQKIKNLTKTNIKEYIDADQALRSWGGEDDYVFHFEPEVRSTSDLDLNKSKKVHFADGTPNGVIPSPVTTPTRQINSSTASYDIHINPSDVLQFDIDNTAGETAETLTLHNNDSRTLSYKIKTTAPEKYRVRPTVGILQSNATANIAVVLQPGCGNTQIVKDKFLIMAIPVDSASDGELSSSELSDLWKNAGNNVMQHRVRVGLKKTNLDRSNNGIVNAEHDKMFTRSNEMSKLHSEVEYLREEIHQIRIQLWVLILLVGLLCGLLLYYVKYTEQQQVRTHDSTQSLPSI